MEPNEISRYYPLLYHMAEGGSWRNISRHGLLSTRSLIELFEVNAAARETILRRRRSTSVELTHDLAPQSSATRYRSVSRALRPASST